MATLESIQAELTATQAAIKTLMQPRFETAIAAQEAAEAAKSDEQKLLDLQTNLNRAKALLAQLQNES